MAFYEEMYYSLPENERETFIKTLSEEDRNSLMLALDKNSLYSNISSSHKDRFESIYNELKDEKSKKSFIAVFNYLDDNSKEKLLDIVFKKINNDKISEEYNSLDYISDMLPQYSEKLNKLLDLRKFRRILQFIIDIKIVEVLSSISEISYSDSRNSILYIDSDPYKSDYDYYKNDNEKLLNMLYKFPEEKRIYFFEEFEKNNDFKNAEFVKMLRVILNMDKEAFLYIFQNVKETDINNIGNYGSVYELHSYGEKSIGYYLDNYRYNKITAIYKYVNSKIEKFFFLRIFESIIYSQTKKIINIFDNLNYDMQENVNRFSSKVVLEKLEDYINLFSNGAVKSEINQKSEKTNTAINNNENTNIDNYIYIEYTNKCKDKLIEISFLIEDFEYAIKEDYKKLCEEIDFSLGREIENKYELNKIIENINNVYRSAYYKKHKKSHLGYIIGDDDDDIDYIKFID